MAANRPIAHALRVVLGSVSTIAFSIYLLCLCFDAAWYEPSASGSGSAAASPPLLYGSPWGWVVLGAIAMAAAAVASLVSSEHDGEDLDPYEAMRREREGR